MLEDFGTNLNSRRLKCLICERIFQRSELRQFELIDHGIRTGQIVFYCPKCLNALYTNMPEMVDDDYLRLPY
jgi:hypothetical protein